MCESIFFYLKVGNFFGGNFLGHVSILETLWLETFWAETFCPMLSFLETLWPETFWAETFWADTVNECADHRMVYISKIKRTRKS